MSCDCSRCQTEGCNANDLCPCCLYAEVERLTAELDRARLLQSNALDGLREQTKVTIEQGQRIRAALTLLLPDTTGRSVPGDVRGTTTFPCCQHCPPDGSIHGLHFMQCVECAVAALRGESDD